MRLRTTRFVTLLALAFGVSACTAETAVIGLSLASVMATERTPIDHGASVLTGKDCGILHITRDKDSWCREYVDPQEQARSVDYNAPFCYRTLGAISCYDRPDPFRNRDTPVQ